jgi:uncharacterized protein YndB with AHSA1/START domain
MDIDVARYIGATAREVASRDVEGKPARVVVIERTYDTTLVDLWDAVTNPERLPRWFLPIEGDLKVGGKYQLIGNAGGTILACDAPRAVSVTWEMRGDVSWVNLTLSDAPGGGATLKLEHIAHVAEHWNTYGPGAVGIGWELGLLGLARHLETGEPVDAPAFMAWSAGDQGKAFIRQSSDGWRQADIAGGADPEASTAAANRTAGFYTGEPVS